jgi:hypothetical protein
MRFTTLRLGTDTLLQLQLQLQLQHDPQAVVASGARDPSDITWDKMPHHHAWHRWKVRDTLTTL